MSTRGIRGAITIDQDQVDLVFEATRELLSTILEINSGIQTEDIASVVFTVSDDISSTYPARAVRDLLDWDNIPLLCAREIPVPDGLPLCIRVLLHWNTEVEQKDVQHAYLKRAARLRPDLVPDQETNASLTSS